MVVTVEMEKGVVVVICGKREESDGGDCGNGGVVVVSV